MIFQMLCVFLYLYIPISASFALEVPPPAEPPDSLLEAFTRLLSLERYDSAATLERSFTPGPEHQPWTDLLRATRLLTQEADFGDTLDSGLFFSSLDAARSRFSEALDAHPDTLPEVRASWLEAMGTVEGLAAQRYQEVEDRPLAAIRPAKESARYFRQACTLDSTRLSAQAGFLFYDFWHDQALHFLSWTPFVADRREQILRQLEEIVHSPHRARWSTAPGLLWTLIEAGKPKKASNLADTLLKARGEVRNLLEPTGKALFLEGQWAGAVDRYERLVAAIQNAPRRNLVREIGALHRLGHAYAALQQWDQVRRVVQDVDSLPLGREQRQRKKEDLKRLHALDKEARKHLSAGR